MQSTFDQYRTTFGQILTRDFRRTSPQRHIDKRDFFLALIGLAIGPLAVHSETDVADCRPAGNVAHFRVAGQIANQNDFIERGHKKLRVLRLPHRPAEVLQFVNLNLRRPKNLRPPGVLCVPGQDGRSQPILRVRRPHL